METISLSEYYDRLLNHDWHYQRSEDVTVRKRGSSNRNELAAISSANGGQYSILFSQFSSHFFRDTPLPEKDPAWDK